MSAGHRLPDSPLSRGHRPAEGVARRRVRSLDRSRELGDRTRDGWADPVRQVLETAVDAFVVVDAGGRIMEWNRQAERLFGYPREEVLGERLSLHTSDTGDEQPLPEIAHGDGAAGGRRLTLPAVGRNGRSVPVELTVWPTRWGTTQCYGAVFRVLAPAAVQQMSCQSGSIVASTDAAVFSQDLDGRVLTWNRGAEQVYGYSAREMTGRSALVVIPPEVLADVERQLEGVTRGTPVTDCETVRLRKDGTRVEVSVTISPVYDLGDDLVAISTIARDITEQRRLARDREAALAEAREAEARTRRFLADAAHQLRNPLAGLRACADSLLRTSSASTREQLLAHLIDDVARAARLVDRLLRIARLDRGLTIVAKPIDVAVLAEAEAERIRIHSPGLDLVVRTEELADPVVSVDREAMQEALGNLLDNARRYAQRRIEVSLARRGSWLLVGVADDGPGLPPEKVERAFERFTTLDRKSGSGLGLPIARDLARSHGGDLTYDEGAFVLRVPVGAAPPSPGNEV